MVKRGYPDLAVKVIWHSELALVCGESLRPAGTVRLEGFLASLGRQLLLGMMRPRWPYRQCRESELPNCNSAPIFVIFPLPAWPSPSRQTTTQTRSRIGPEICF